MSDQKNSKPTTIAIVGASVRAAVQSAQRAGFLPVAADLFADADLRRICPVTRISDYPHGLCDWLTRQDVDGWFYTGALENYPELVDRMAAAMANVAPLWGNGGSVLHKVRSPLRLQQTLTEAGLLFPETHNSPHKLPLDRNWLAKTYRGSSGCGVHLWAGSTVEGTETETREIFYQRFVEGTPISALFAAVGPEAKCIGIAKQLIDVNWTHAKPFQYAGSIGPWNTSEQAEAEIVKIGNLLAREFKLIGLFGVDMILCGDQVWTLEVNPRYTASVEVIERAAGIVAVKAHVDACLRGQASCEATVSQTVAGKAILFAPTSAVVPAALTSWALQRSHQQPWPEHALAFGDVPLPGTQIEAGQPVLTVFAQADQPDQVEHQLRQLAEEAETRLYA